MSSFEWCMVKDDGTITHIGKDKRGNLGRFWGKFFGPKQGNHIYLKRTD